MKQVKYFNLQLDILGILEEINEEVVDPVYGKQIEAYPLSIVDWSTLEEDDLQTKTFPIITKIENGLQEKEDQRQVSLVFRNPLLAQIWLILFFMLMKFSPLPL